MSLSPILHQVCSSGFIHEDFLSVMKQKVPTLGTKSDWTNRAFSHFELLMNFCRLANKTIKAAVDRFIMRSIVISNMLNENDFNTQINVTLDQFYQSTVADFRFAVDIQRLFMQIDQPYTGKGSIRSSNTVEDLIIKENIAHSVNNQKLSQVSFLFTEIYDTNLTWITCGCATDIHCQSSAIILYDRSSSIDRMAAKRLGQWTTRLYIILLIIGLSIPALYAIIQSQTLTKTYVKPSFKLYEKLQRDHENALECPCSSIATAYNEFVKIDARFHEICSSPFASNQWYINLTAGLVSNLSIYDQRDYRRFFSAHLQFLQGLCNISNESISNTIDQFLSSLLITTQLLPKRDFHARVNSQMELSKSNAPTALGHFLFLIRNINHGNAIISKYGTNFQYIPDYEYRRWTGFEYLCATDLYTKAIIYDDECSCGLSSLCTTQATFIKSNASKKIPIQGLKMGCTPSESFRASTLECFYNQSCLDLIQQYTNYKAHINPIIPSNKSQFSINTTMAELIDHLFIEEWGTTINYTTYFEKCSPLSCSYTYIQRFNIFYIITLLLSFQGGLTILLKWICPKLVYGLAKIYNYRKRQTNIIQSSCSHGISTINITTTNVYNADIDPKPIPTNRTLRPANIVILVGYGDGRFSKPTMLSIVSNNVPECFAIVDFNDDGQLDIAIKNERSMTISIYFGRDGGTFELPKWFYTGPLSSECRILANDFNGDTRIDLLCYNSEKNLIGVMTGHANRTFELPKWSNINNISASSNISDNNFYVDTRYEIILNNIWKKTLTMSVDKQETVYFVSDYNCDDHADIICYRHHYAIFGLLGQGNGNFVQQTILSRIDYESIRNIAVGDFDNDTYQDIIITYHGSSIIEILINRCECCKRKKL
ncbi:unnamed protein product [Adineta steineri]|uniref:Uncharacterized protein n=1 Tax=Adineta steineri TaxID=433720 RepID=A0A815NTM6_9BILA|nr:unnamed protein product [Adineta steineri]CAF1451668.1 unnamed protein product [Adineta steineri]